MNPIINISSTQDHNNLLPFLQGLLRSFHDLRTPESVQLAIISGTLNKIIPQNVSINHCHFDVNSSDEHEAVENNQEPVASNSESS